ncbi:hypothetical protein KEM48_002947 [Puccinia striiformis f. sp. tritici PST-130]|nr:hypothetical protein KEM48_002947 [Puccinia striiformis f. sp. tritici PST-130]
MHVWCRAIEASRTHPSVSSPLHPNPLARAQKKAHRFRLTGPIPQPVAKPGRWVRSGNHIASKRGTGPREKEA